MHVSLLRPADTPTKSARKVVLHMQSERSFRKQARRAHFYKVAQIFVKWIPHLFCRLEHLHDGFSQIRAHQSEKLDWPTHCKKGPRTWFFLHLIVTRLNEARNQAEYYWLCSQTGRTHLLGYKPSRDSKSDIKLFNCLVEDCNYFCLTNRIVSFLFRKYF